MLKKILQLTPMQMFGLSSMLLGIDIFLVMMFFYQPDILSVNPNNWDFRIDEVRSVDGKETDVAGVSVSRDNQMATAFPTATPTPTPTPSPVPTVANDIHEYTRLNRLDVLNSWQDILQELKQEAHEHEAKPEHVRWNIDW